MTFAEDVKSLDAELPLVLLPLRLEARFFPHAKPTELRVRLLPDVVHADGHDPDLTDGEAGAGRQYWQDIWRAAGDEDRIADARATLASEVGPYRSVWVATTLRPTNGRAAPGAPMPKDAPLKTEPSFPQIKTVAAPRTARATLLPRHLIVRAEFETGVLRTYPCNELQIDLGVAPSLVAMSEDGGVDEWLGHQDLRWIVDFGEAVTVGMAVTIPMKDIKAHGGGQIQTLLALGVMPGGEAIARGDDLDELLESHRLSIGLDILPQGTPTNATVEAPSGVSVQSPDLAVLHDVDGWVPLRDRLTSAGKADTLTSANAADAVSRAFGRLRGNALDRTARAANDDVARSGAMNAVLWPATIGHALTSPLAIDDSPARSLLTGPQLANLRSWFETWVRATGPLPTVRIGAQPYGLLPVTTPRDERKPAGPTIIGQVDERTTGLRQLWREAVQNVHQLDPDATDAPPSGDDVVDAIAVGQVLGATPHPHAFTLRHVDEEVGADTARLVLFMLILEMGAGAQQEGYHRAILEQLFEATRDGLLSEDDAETQYFNATELLASLEQLDDVVPSGPYEAFADLVELHILPLLLDRLERSRAVRRLTRTQTGDAVNGDDVIRLAGSEVTDDVVAVGHTVTADGSVEATMTWLDRAIADAGRITADGRPTHDLSTERPLLHQLVARTLELVHHTQTGAVIAGLTTLRAVLDTDPDPHATLDRLMRETIGLASHRLDAWTTSVATHRLAHLREKRPTGTQIGAYGWLQHVRPTEDEPSQGFIHASSMDHAATAAVLRSGWSAFAGSGDDEAPLAVDLRSDRVRAARWILDGVRRGQDLPSLLGGRFERRLHDARLDVWIEPVRQGVLHGTGSGDARPMGVVDGLVLARAFSDLDRTEIETRVEEMVLEAHPTEPVLVELRALAGELDAVADLLMTQTVHALLRGDAPEAQAALSSQGAADASVPPITVTRTHRDAQVVQLRTVAAWDAGADAHHAASAQAVGPVEQLEPLLAAWVRSLLPHLGDVVAGVRWTVTATDGSTRTGATRLQLDQLGLGALEVMLLAGHDATQEGSRLSRIVHGWAARTVPASATADLGPDPFTITVEVATDRHAMMDDAEVTVDELGLAAAAVASLVASARPLRVEDLMPPQTAPEPALPGHQPLRRRGDGLRQAIADATGRLDGNAGARRTALTALATLRVGGSLAALERGAADDPLDDLSEVLANAETRVAAWDAVAEAGVRDVELLRDAVRRMAGGTLPLVEPFAANDAVRDTATSMGSKERRVDARDHARGWIRRTSHVRANLAALRTVQTLGQALTGRGDHALAVGQLPLPADADQADPWCAITRPATDAQRLSTVSVTGHKPFGSDHLAGLVLDTFSDRIPSKQQDTAVAVHFDAPTARPPQAILIATTREGELWSPDVLESIVLDTLAQARERAVGPTQMPDLGQTLPFIYLPDTVAVSGAPTDTEVDA